VSNVQSSRLNKPSLLNEVATIALIGVAVFVFLALVSWDPNDPSIMHSHSNDTVKNLIGIVGAYLSDILYSALGISTWLITILLLWRGSLSFISYRRGEEPVEWWINTIRFIAFLTALFAASALCSQLFSNDFNSLPFGAGGKIGQSFATLLAGHIGAVGTYVLLTMMMLGSITIFVEFSWAIAVKLLLRSISRFFSAIANTISSNYNRLKAYLELRRDRMRHRSIQQARVAAVQERKPLAEPLEHKPAKPKPTILPPVVDKTSITSDRLLKEKQTTLFEAEGSEPALPTLDLLDSPKADNTPAYSTQTLEAMSQLLEARLQEFNIKATVEAVLPGPVVTSFEIQPAAGIKGSRITSLARDLARSLAVKSVRVVEIIPGKPFVGIEIPNENRQMVMLQDVLNSKVFDDSKSPLTLALGHDIGGEPVVGDLAKMPHLLVAGTTGSGKSVGINVMLLSLLFKATPDEVRLILIDPKMLELSVYDDIPHLLTPVITDMEDAENGLRWCVGEMERRYKLMSMLGVRNLAGYNKMVKEAIAKGEPIPDPTYNPEGEFVPEGITPDIPTLDALPSIVVVIDEFADMMMIVGKKVEQLIARIAQKARAAGIHLILATQRPSVDVITGLIKANVPTRIAFQVSSKIDSRTILDQGGAEQLLGHGDMLYLAPGTSNTQRVHGAFVDDHEVHAVVAKWKAQAKPNYIEAITDDQSHVSVPGMKDEKSDGGAGDESDPLYDEAVAFVTESRKASISAVQRQLKVGYNRAARLVDAMEAAGVLSEAGHNGARKVLAPKPPR